MTESNWVPEEVPLDRPNVARMYDYFLGGAHNFAVDREAAQQLYKLFPDLPLIAQANRAGLRRAVVALVEAGVDQFLDIGSGIPTAGPVHEIAQRVNPRARVVYVDVEPVAVAHSRAILQSVPNTTAVRADAREAAELVHRPEVRELIDFQKPIGVLLVALLHFVPDDEVALQMVRSLREAVPSGSYIVISHAATEQSEPDRLSAVERVYRESTSPFHFRSREQIAALFEGFELI
ncbi:MAG: SAM-dependent methyltransferase, partial [Chloroflexi bacterium]|nr:SAM-dependent methyltransferase [Chloroflexota bacterium]